MQDQLQAIRNRIGNNVRELRERRGWSQPQLAKRAGNTGKHIGQIERGEVNVTIDILTAIAAQLAVDVVRLLQDPAAPPERYTIPGDVLADVERAFQALVKAKSRQSD